MHGKPNRSRALQSYKTWTSEEREYIEKWYGIIPTGTIAEVVRRTVPEINDMAAMLGLDPNENLGEYIRHSRWRLRPFTVIKP